MHKKDKSLVKFQKIVSLGVIRLFAWKGKGSQEN
jgi:hypothetical protein